MLSVVVSVLTVLSVLRVYLRPERLAWSVLWLTDVQSTVWPAVEQQFEESWLRSVKTFDYHSSDKLSRLDNLQISSKGKFSNPRLTLLS